MDEKLKTARKKLGKFFRERREEMGYDLETVATFLGITPNTLNGIETGRFAWDIDLQHRLCAALEIKPYFSAIQRPSEENYRLHKEDDPKRYYGFFAADNVLIHPNYLTIIKLSYPRVAVRFNYANTFFSSYEDWKANHTDIQWLDPNDKPETESGMEEVLVDCWNFLALQEKEENRLMEEGGADEDFE